MAENVSDWIWQHSKAANASLIVLLAIAHEANSDGQAEMGIAELAAKCHLGERTVQTAIRELAASGVLQAARSVGRGHRTHYRVLINPAESAPFEQLNPAESAPFTETPQILHPAESAPFTGHTPRSGRKGADSAPLQTSDVIRSTGTYKEQVKETSAISERADVERLCRHLADRVEANGSKRPPVSKRWRDAARLMLDNDGRTEQQIMTAIDWCQDHEFWRSNILSMPKLREKYEQLRLQATRKPPSRQTQTGELFDRAMARAKAREEANDPNRDRVADQVRPSLLPAPGHR